MPQKMDPPSTFDLPTRTLAAVVGHAQQAEGDLLADKAHSARVEKEKVQSGDVRRTVEEGKERGKF